MTNKTNDIYDNDPRKLRDDAHAALHRCWTKAVGTPGYNKDDWKLIERQLHTKCRCGCLARDIYPKIAP